MKRVSRNNHLYLTKANTQEQFALEEAETSKTGPPLKQQDLEDEVIMHNQSKYTNI